AIEFDHQLSLDTAEVCDIRRDRVLAAKCHPVETTSAQVLPKLALSVRGVPAQSTRVLQSHCWQWWLDHRPFAGPLPQPLSHRERGFVFCAAYSTPCCIWSRSMLSNRAWKLPSPKPSLPLRWMISKKIGPSALVVKICSSLRCFVSGSASIRILFLASRSTSSPWSGIRWSITSKYASGVSRNSTPASRIASTVE